MSDVLGSSQGFILQDSGFSGSCHKGTLVAQNSEGVYVPAAAVWDTSVVRSDGSWVPSYSAYVKGILITEPVNNYAAILCTGWSSDPDLLDSLEIDEEEGVGDYFLTTDGKATRGDLESREMRVYCYSVLGSGKIFVKPEPPEYAGHAHNYYTFPTYPSPWTVSYGSSSSSGSSDIPSEARAYVYTDATTYPELFNMLRANPQYPCLVKNGTEVDRSQWDFTYEQGTDPDTGDTLVTGAYLYITFDLEAGDAFELHAITPLTANEPIVRSVKATRTNKLLDITNVGGKVFIGVNNTPTQTNTYTGTGIVSLDSNGIKTGPVIQALYSGPGISLGNYVDYATHEVVPGAVTITATQFAGTMIDMNVCNLDRVVMGTSFNGISYVFPQGATSMLIGTMRVPHFESTTTSGKLVFVFQGNGGSISNLTANVIVQAIPEDEPTPIASGTSYTVPSIGSTSTGNCYKSIVDLGDTIQSDALVILKLSSTGSVAVTLVSASLVLS